MNKILEILIWFFPFLGNGIITGKPQKLFTHLLPIQDLGWMSFCLLLITNCLLSTAQTFPVQVVPQTIAPAPIYFSSYADASFVNGPLRVQLILNDLGIADREIRLKAYFEGNGISFQSKDMVSGSSSMYLEGGIPLVLTNSELAPYFRFENITGVSPNVYGQAIPEGTYKFCFEVYDILTGKRLSQKSCYHTVVFQNEPPFLVAPANRSNLGEANPQNIVFQWSPMSSPEIWLQVKIEFTLLIYIPYSVF